MNNKTYALWVLEVVKEIGDRINSNPLGWDYKWLASVIAKHAPAQTVPVVDAEIEKMLSRFDVLCYDEFSIIDIELAISKISSLLIQWTELVEALEAKRKAELFDTLQ